jgi:hypothetical protein
MAAVSDLNRLAGDHIVSCRAWTWDNAHAVTSSAVVTDIPHCHDWGSDWQ